MQLSKESESTLRSSYDEQNEMTLTLEGTTEKLPTVHTEKYDVEQGELETVDRVNTTNYVDVTIASMIELPEPDSTFYETIPDGGYGWVIAACGFLSNFIMFGISAVWGVFSNAYATSTLEGKSTTLELMGVGSLMVVMLNLFSPVGSLCIRLGIKTTMGIGTFLMALGMIMGGFSTEVWHLYVTLGLVFGFGSSLVYMSIVSVIPQWFSARRGTAMGLSSAGSGFGGLAISPMVTSLVEKYGLPWAHRIIGLMAFGICAIASCLIRTRLPPGAEKQPMKSPIKLSMLKNFNFVIMLAG
ncbi:hypothetical protein G6F46_011740 [Rhizopus delemar]|nr:hypothetical protein G6F55_011354 [Rhizopus delemar]KAG1499053.1 hypothetical protein G6F53_011599 [Rhizopus delemar]KAG1514003.1 hypothetical protein G6F52_010027 [Rhizopus delemar]KAG1534932.1 hypothetical protein G6F51_011815 [Rhizopus arrhizus]KAG1608180.1 hypothetical protein G6F46_011740 [Rhizopus delemar]